MDGRQFFPQQLFNLTKSAMMFHLFSHVKNTNIDATRYSLTKGKIILAKGRNTSAVGGAHGNTSYRHAFDSALHQGWKDKKVVTGSAGKRR